MGEQAALFAAPAPSPVPAAPHGAIVTPLGWHFPDLRDFEFRLVIEGRPIVKKNHLTAIIIGKRRSIAPDTIYRAWEREAHRQLTEQWGAVFKAPIPKHIGINLAVITYLENRRGWPDISGTYEGPADVLQAHRPKCDLTIMPKLKTTRCRQHAGVIANDSQIRGHVGSDIILDRNNPPRVELIITPPIKTPPRDCQCQQQHK